MGKEIGSRVPTDKQIAIYTYLKEDDTTQGLLGYSCAALWNILEYSEDYTTSSIKGKKVRNPVSHSVYRVILTFKV